VDPERQWLARLEPETPEDRQAELNEAPLGRLPFGLGSGVLAVCGILELAVARRRRTASAPTAS
jgi:hypothetical protein